MTSCEHKWEEVYSGELLMTTEDTLGSFSTNKDETPEVLQDLLTMIPTHSSSSRYYCCMTEARNSLNKTLHAYFKEEGIEHQTSTPRTPEQNGVVERRNRTLVEAARTMLSASKLPLSFWAEAQKRQIHHNKGSDVLFSPLLDDYYYPNTGSLRKTTMIKHECIVSRKRNFLSIPLFDKAKYALEILKKHNMDNCHSIGTPLATKPKLDVDLSGEPVDQSDYHSKIGSLMHFQDADHAGCLDLGKALLEGSVLGDKLVSWRCQKQNLHCNVPSAEAEYVGYLQVCELKLMWMRTQLQDYGFNYNKIPLYCDSQSACNLMPQTQYTFANRAQSISLSLHKGQVENGLIDYILSELEYQLADIVYESPS
ncbi:retrovirus-related pol polyprotein from transposon TNT 1-94 [Tanacetum coccineum]